MEKEISKERLNQLCFTLRPLVREGKKLFSIKEVDAITDSFTWNPVLEEEILNLEEYTRVPFFSYSYPLFWKPSIKEVLVEVQDNKKLLEECNWFEVVHEGMDVIEGKGNYGIAIFYKNK